MKELKVCFNNEGFFFPPLPHTHPNPPIFASANGRVGSREAEALGHKEDFSYCEKQAPKHLPQNQTKDGICRRRMTTPKHTGDPHSHTPLACMF